MSVPGPEGPDGPPPAPIDIEDPGDARLDDFRDLARADRRPDRPGGRGLVIAEGSVVVRRLLGSPYPVRSVLGVPARLAELDGDLRGRSVPRYRVSAEVMAEVVGFHLNRGVLAVADRARFPPLDELLAAAGSLAVLEGVGDHENLGSIFRNAAALGVDAVVLGPGCSDPLYRRAVRVSMGTVLRVPFAVSELPVLELLTRVRAAGFAVWALTPAPDAEPLAVGPIGRTAVLLGAEGPGLTAAALAAADRRVGIPMAAGVDSLNVATAAALTFAVLTGRISAGGRSGA